MGDEGLLRIAIDQMTKNAERTSQLITLQEQTLLMMQENSKEHARIIVGMGTLKTLQKVGLWVFGVTLALLSIMFGYAVIIQ